MDVRSTAERVACMVLCASSLVSAGAVPAGEANPALLSGPIRSAFLDGRAVSFRFAPVPRGKRARRVGPWYFGPWVSNSKPRDHRLNFYFVVPGANDGPESESQDPSPPSAIISDLPVDDQPVEWDVYWAVVLDPALQQDFRSERELILAAQREFRPAGDFQFEQIPGAEFLRRVLKISSINALDKYRRASGNLPQVLILPAEFAIRASVDAAEGGNSSPVAPASEPSSPLQQ